MTFDIEREERGGLDDERGVLEIGFNSPEALMSLKEFEVS